MVSQKKARIGRAKSSQEEPRRSRVTDFGSLAVGWGNHQRAVMICDIATVMTPGSGIEGRFWILSVLDRGYVVDGLLLNVCAAPVIGGVTYLIIDDIL